MEGCNGGTTVMQRWSVKVGDLITPWPDDQIVGLIVEFISDQWSDRFLILSDGEILEVPCHQTEVISEGG
jgi:hypothetical protein